MGECNGFTDESQSSSIETASYQVTLLDIDEVALRRGRVDRDLERLFAGERLFRLRLAGDGERERESDLERLCSLRGERERLPGEGERLEERGDLERA